MEAVTLLVGLGLGAVSVWLMERYHERKRDQLFSAIGQMQMQIEGMKHRIAELEQPPIPEEEM